MTHDPLCTFPDYPYNICWLCDLIAKVRADTLDIVQATMDAIPPHHGKYDGWLMRDHDVRAAIDALRGEA